MSRKAKVTLSVGVRVGKLVLVALGETRTHGKQGKRQRIYQTWYCHCDCGNTILLGEKQLRYEGTTQCFSCAISGKRNAKYKHGATAGRREQRHETPEYRTWKAMRNRCNNPKFHQYGDYGGRGIKVCERWLDSFENFLRDMGQKPTLQHSIDRLDADKDYNPENCRWATDGEQRRNKRTTRYITLDGKTKALVDWLAELELPRSTWDWRKSQGWSDKKALLFHKSPH